MTYRKYPDDVLTKRDICPHPPFFLMDLLIDSQRSFRAGGACKSPIGIKKEYIKPQYLLSGRPTHKKTKIYRPTVVATLEPNLPRHPARPRSAKGKTIAVIHDGANKRYGFV
jgi:hypothetical protein